MVYFLEVVWNISVEGEKKCSGHFSVFFLLLLLLLFFFFGYLWNKT